MESSHAPPKAQGPGNRPACDPAVGRLPHPAQACTPPACDGCWETAADRPEQAEAHGAVPPRPPVPSSPPRETDARRVVGLSRRLARSSSGRGVDLLDRLSDVLEAADGLVAAAVRMIQKAQRGDTTETCEQLGLERWLRLAGARTYGDATTLVAMAEVLGDMPETQRLMEEGVLSADVVRRLAVAVKDRRVADRRRLDTAVAANLDLLASMSSEAAWGAIQRLVQREREDLAETREDRAYDRRFVALQPALDGSGALYGQFPAAQFTTVAAGLDAAARRHHEADGTQPGWKTMGRARADGLEELCQLELGGATTGNSGSRRRARPSMQVVVDIHDVQQLEDHQLWGQLLAPSGPVQLTPRTIRRMLAEDDPVLRTVFCDGYEILGITKPTKHIPEALKAALAVRDGHARSPGSTAPAGEAHRNHAVTKRIHGGSPAGRRPASTRTPARGATTFDNLAFEDLDFHIRLDDEDTAWTMTVEPDGSPAGRRPASTRTPARGVCTYTNPATGTTFTTLPRSMREVFAPDHPAYGGDRNGDATGGGDHGGRPDPGRDPP